MKHSETKNVFWDVNNKKWRKWCKFVPPFLLITLMAYRCSRWTPNVQIKFFMFDWSIFTIFVLNRGCKRNTLQLIICIYLLVIKHRWLKTRLGKWITRNFVNGVRMIHLSYWITFMAYLCTHGHQMSKASILCLIGRSTEYLCKIRAGIFILSKRWYSKMFAQHVTWVNEKCVLRNE
jgi:hypothetical protein